MDTAVTLQHTVADVLRRAYDGYADRVAMVRQDGSEVTFGEFKQTLARVAGGFAALGAGPGQRVVVAVRNSPEFFTVDHALLWGGTVRVAVSFRLHAQEIASIAADAGARAVVVDADRVEAVEESLKALGVEATVVVTSAVGDRPTVATLAESAPADPYAWAPEELMWMPYTSGTTGAPKGVVHTSGSIMACARNIMAELMPITPEDTVMQAAPMSHLAGWVSLVYAMRGARQLFLADFQPELALRTIEKHRVTSTPVVPTIINMMTEEAERGDYDTSSLRTIVYAGSPIAAERLARSIKAFGSVFVQFYGLTELPMPIASLSAEDHRLCDDGSVPAKLGSAGRVTPFVDVQIVDSDGRPLPDGEAGEIWVRGDMVMRGYWQLPEESEAFIREGGWRGTGDVGKLVDGYLHIVDRKRDMIVSGGFNVFPSEVEKVIATIPGVSDVAVVGVPDPRWGETVLAAVVRQHGSQLDAETVSRICRESIAGYKQPRRIEFIDELPKNSSGKLMRRELRESYWAGRERLVDG